MLFGPSGYGLRQGVLMVPAHFGRLRSAVLFALLIERFGVSALLLSITLALAGLAALLAITPSSSAERASSGRPQRKDRRISPSAPVAAVRMNTPSTWSWRASLRSK